MMNKSILNSFIPFMVLLFGLTDLIGQPCSFNGGLGDSPCNPIPLTVNGTCSFSSARTNGCGNFGNSGTCGSGNNNDVWGVFTTATPMNITVRHNSSNRNMTVHVYTLAGSCAVFGNLTQIACSNANPGTGNEDVVIASLPAGTYYVRAQAIGANGLAGNGFCVFGSSISNADNPWPGADLGTLTCPSTTSVSDNTSGANQDCGVSSAGDHIYQFTLTQNMDVTIDVCSATWDTQLHLFNLTNGNCNAGSIATNDDNCGLQSSITMSCLVSGTYVVVVEGFGGNEGAYTLNITTSNCGCTIPPTDCGGGTTVCNDQSFSGNSSGSGTQELNGTNSGCLSTENQSSWYFFEAVNGGTIEFTISPQNGTDDYDFAVWGPYPTGSTPGSICPPSQSPLRCSWAAGGGNTGLLSTETDVSEGAGGNKFVDSIQANAGDVYILLIDNFSSSSQPFDLSWNLTNGASLDCTPLPVEFIYFAGESLNDGNLLNWTTVSEINNNFFDVQRSEDGINFYSIGKVLGNGNSNSLINYSYKDNQVESDHYYRLKQVDYNGEYEFSNTIFVKQNIDNEINIYPSPTTGTLFFDFKSVREEFVWLIYTNVVGSSSKELVKINKGSNTYKTTRFSKLSPGIYFVQVLNENGEVLQTKKVVKQ